MKIQTTILLLGLVALSGCSGEIGDHPPVHPTKKVSDMTYDEQVQRIKNLPLPDQAKQAALEKLKSDFANKPGGAAPH